MFSLRGMLVKSESTSKLPIGTRWVLLTNLFSKLNESLTLFSFLVKGINMKTKGLARLYAGVCKADKIGRNEG